MWLDKSRAPTPIFVDEDQFNSGSRRGGLYKICGIAEDAQEAIRSLQPYLHGDAAESQSLWLLQQMSNIDKHRYLNLSVIGRYPGMSFFVDPNVEITAVSSPDDRTVVARAHPRTPGRRDHRPAHPAALFRQLPKLRVAGSIPVVRSEEKPRNRTSLQSARNVDGLRPVSSRNTR
jgi:hypothetical protein